MTFIDADIDPREAKLFVRLGKAIHEVFVCKGTATTAYILREMARKIEMEGGAQ